MSWREGGLDCKLDRPWRFSRRARGDNLPSLTQERQAAEIKQAYTQKQEKMVLGANSLVSQLAQKSVASRASSRGSDKVRGGSRSFSSLGGGLQPGGSFLEGAGGSSSVSMLSVPSVIGGGGSVVVADVLREYKGALDIARQQHAEEEQEEECLPFSPVQAEVDGRGMSLMRLGSTSGLHMTSSAGRRTPSLQRPSTSTPLFACRFDGCGRKFTMAKDLFIHECQAHSEINPRGAFIPLESTLSGSEKRASTAHLVRRLPTRDCCSGRMAAVPVSRPQSGISIDVLQQQRKWHDYQQLAEWKAHRETVLTEYRKKLDRELGKTRDPLPMGPLLRRAKLALVLDRDEPGT